MKRPLLPNPAQPGTLLVPLTKGYFAIIDEADGPAVGARNWSVSIPRDSRTAYATARFVRDGRSVTVGLHRFIWELHEIGSTPEIDHRNTNGLDCRRENLRAATHAQNVKNVRMRSDNSTGYKGVSFVRREGKYAATISSGGKAHNLGRFAKAEDAAEAYNNAAVALHGDFARTDQTVSA